MEKSKVAVVLPAYNEEETIKGLLISIKRFADPIVVNDGSTDGTLKILKEIKVQYLNNLENLGYENSILKGLKYARRKNYKYIVTFDSDNQHKIKDLKKIIMLLKTNNFSCVYGVRKKLQRFSETIFSKISKILYDLDDPLCGMKGYVSKQLKFTSKFENTICTELLFDMKRRNLLIKQFPIETNYRKNVSRFGGFFYSNFKILNSIFPTIKNYRS